MAKTETSLPLEWVRTIPRDLAALDTVPLVGFPPKFPWEKFSEKLQNALGLKSLTVEGSAPEWRSKNELTKGMGKALLPFTFSIPGMVGLGQWLMEEADLQYLMGLVLTQKASPFPVEDADFQEGFTRFLGMEILDVLGKSDFDPTLAPHLQQQTTPLDQDALTIDTTATVGQKKIIGRLCLTKQLQEACKSHFAKGAEHAAARGPLSQKLEVELHMELGRCALSQPDWEATRPGDFIILDSCSWIPDEQKGRVILTLSQTPLFRGRLKKGKIKILEYPLYREVDTMKNDHTDDESEEMSFEEETEMEPEDSFVEEESAIEEEDAEEAAEQEDEELEDEEFEAEDEPTAGIKVAKSASPASLEDIPLNLVIEAGRLKMTIQKLSELHPGNVLDLNIRPEAGVDLVVNGRLVGKGELLKVGETLGVRVLEIG